MAKTAAKTTAPAEKTKRAPNAAFAAPKKPSAALAAVIGAEPVAATEAVKKIWDYIKSNNLQKPTDKRVIVADAKLKVLFGADELSMLKMAGVISKNLG